MRMETDRLDSLALPVARAVPDFDEEKQRIAIAVYRRLAEGSPAPAIEVAERARTSVRTVEELLAQWPGVFLDSQKRVIGFWGLSIHRLSPTHRLQANGQELFAWCAWDTMFLPGILDRKLAVESVCPTTNDTVSLVVSPSDIVETSHPKGVVSFLLPDRDFDSDIIQSFCHFVYFFVSEQAGEAWTAQHRGTFLLSLPDAFQLGRRVNQLNFPAALGTRP